MAGDIPPHPGQLGEDSAQQLGDKAVGPQPPKMTRVRPTLQDGSDPAVDLVEEPCPQVVSLDVRRARLGPFAKHDSGIGRIVDQEEHQPARPRPHLLLRCAFRRSVEQRLDAPQQPLDDGTYDVVTAAEMREHRRRSNTDPSGDLLDPQTLDAVPRNQVLGCRYDAVAGAGFGAGRRSR